MKFQIKTKNPKEVNQALIKLRDDLLIKRGQLGDSIPIASYSKVKPSEFFLEIVYNMENRFSNWIVERELKKQLKILDRSINIKKL